MNNIQFNLNAMNKRYPQLAQSLSILKDDGTVRIATTKLPNRPTCYVKANNEEWLLHSTDNPAKEAEMFAHVVLKDNFKNVNTIVFLGLGMGYYMEQICTRYGSNNPNMIIIENNVQIFKKFIETQRPMVRVGNQDISIFEFDRCHFVVDVPVDKIYYTLYDVIQNANRTSFSTFHIVEHPILIRFNKEYYKPACAEINRICYDIRSSYGNDPEDSWFGIDHMLQNLDIIASNPGAERVKDQFRYKPAVVVATGPSLNKNIHLLPKIKNKCVFFAADASLNTFFNYSPIIRPDIVCSLERNLSTKKHFEQISTDKKQLMTDMYLAACPVVKPELYKEWHGKHMVIFRDFAHFKWLRLITAVLNTGKSVTNMAFKIAEYMGCDPIILVGQDLSYAPTGDSHVSGADHARDGLATSPLIHQKVKVMGNSGEMLDSLDTWVGMLKRFEFDIAKANGAYKVINATEGGARINGTEVMTLQDAMDKYLTQDINTERILNNCMIPYDERDVLNNVNTINANINLGIAYLERSLLDIDEALHVLEGGFVLFEQPVGQQLQDIMQHVEKLKEKVLADELCYFVIMHVLQSWCMGRDTMLRGLDNYVRKEELTIAKYLLIFEFFYGLRILFNLVNDGVKKNYYG